MPKQRRLEWVVLEIISEGIETLRAVDGSPKGEEVILSRRRERNSEALTEESKQIALVPNFQIKFGPEHLTQRAFDGRPIVKGILVDDDHDARRTVGGVAGFAVLAAHALNEAPRGVAGVDLDEVWRRPARADLDVGEGTAAQRDLLPDRYVFGWHARIQVQEAEVVATEALEEQASLTGSVFHRGAILLQCNMQ